MRRVTGFSKPKPKLTIDEATKADIIHKTVSLFPCVAAFVNGERVNSAALFTCFKPDKNSRKFLVDFLSDSNNILKTVKFSNWDIKRSVHSP